MAEPIRDPKKLQAQVEEFQTLQRQAQVLGMQNQQMQMQIEELNLAQEALKDATGKVYAAIGNLLVETEKSKAKKDLTEKIEVFEVRKKALAKQETQIKEKLESLRKELEKATGQQSK
ncbi:prefoldin subunit beta [Candidatus Micrarchaeota archaeon CG10_big_fil_rev_8_21_14_0_10_45_29]|nr:MAG: prefoldin subunit beta [Candidatus Micrarchaeota archaeon CG10_big_fil_rev_8_21_14_0_10_45_29]